VIGIVGGLAATLISTSADGSSATLYWGAILAGGPSLVSGLAMGSKRK
jgi:hypothetical protein